MLSTTLHITGVKDGDYSIPEVWTPGKLSGSKLAPSLGFPSRYFSNEGCRFWEDLLFSPLPLYLVNFILFSFFLSFKVNYSERERIKCDRSAYCVCVCESACVLYLNVSGIQDQFLPDLEEKF